MKERFILIGLVFAMFLIAGCAQQSPGPLDTSGQDCIKTGTGEKLGLSEANEIAINSECVDENALTDKAFCNQDTGTWWIDLEMEEPEDKPFCNPACVINVETKQAEINWRCTGLIV